MVDFKHPLARSACLRPAHSLDGTVRFILVIVTTLELDHRHKGYKKPFVERLSQAAREHVAPAEGGGFRPHESAEGLVRLAL
jgi:hypothetical protein